ncbi:hypothetical protein K1719_022218 [Acacia pycnantha]|nr:hypothetical protein K1719_022218 [Acacia pycnantha]
MLEDDKKNKKVAFSEEDAAALLVKYDATTVLTLLQELSNSNYPGGKIDWNELVKSTATGISNVREYQMLWRHLAYREDLTENLEDGAEPLDDDSDLDCEMEAVPPINNDAASEASACVKVMVASGSLSERGPSSSTIEAPMTIHIPNCHSSTNLEENMQHSNSIQGTSVIFPVTVQRQTLPTGSVTESVEAKGTSGGKLSSKRRRKAWSEDEDKQLRELVQKCGEGNWATMSKGDDFPIKRSPTQLAQRWSILRKKDGTTNSGANLTSSQFTAVQLATRHSLSLALDMPLKKLTALGTTDTARVSLNGSIKNPVQPINTAEVSTVQSSSVPPQLPSQQAVLGSSASSANSLVPERTMLKPNTSVDAAVRATAVAAGARIVSSTNILSVQKSTQDRSAGQIMPSGNSSVKRSASAGSVINPKALINTSVSPKAVATAPPPCTTIVKSISPSGDKTTNAQTLRSVVNNLPLEQVNPNHESKVSDSSVEPKKRDQVDGALVTENIPKEEVLEVKLVSQNPGE